MAMVGVKYQKRPEVTKGKESTLGKVAGGVLGVVGGVAGGMAGGIPGALAGAGGGMSLGQTLGGAIDPAKAATVKESGVSAPEPQDSAISRRLAQKNAENMAVLKQAEAALGQLPQDIREKYGPVIAQATQEEERRKAMGRFS